MTNEQFLALRAAPIHEDILNPIPMPVDISD